MVILALDCPELTIIRFRNEVNTDFRGRQSQLVTDSAGQVGFMPNMFEFAAIDGIDLQEQFGQ